MLGEISHQALPWVSLAVITTSMGMVQPLLRDRELLPKAYRSLVMVHAGIGEVVPIVLLSILEGRRSQMGFTLLHFLGYLLIALALMGVAAYYRGSSIVCWCAHGWQLPTAHALCHWLVGGHGGAGPSAQY